MNFLKKLLIFAAVAYVLLIGCIYLIQDRFIYHPTLLDQDFKFNFPMKFEERFLKSQTGFDINYVIFKNPQPKAVILYFHGNAVSLKEWGATASQLAQATQSDLLLFDYPGFGKSSRDFVDSEKQLVQIGKELLYIIKRFYKDLPIYLYGRSLGTGIASELSSIEPVDGLILESPYLSMVKMAQETMPFVPSFLLKVKLDNTKAKKSKLDNILILHGTEDEVISHNYAVELSKILGKKAHLVSIEGGDHDHLPSTSKYWSAIESYFIQGLKN